MSATQGLVIVQEVKELISRSLPSNVELLLVDDLITVHDLFDELLCFSFIHFPHLLNAHLICLHEVFKLCLKVSELFCQLLILDGQIPVSLLRLFLLLVEPLDHLPLDVFVLSFLFLLLFECLLIDSDFFLQNTVVKV